MGYGDIAPHTTAGRALASMLMIAGYGIIAVPTGIVTAEMVEVCALERLRSCAACSHPTSDPAARFCGRCGKPPPQEKPT